MHQQVSSLPRERRANRSGAGRASAPARRILTYVGFGLSVGFAAALLLGFVA